MRNTSRLLSQFLFIILVIGYWLITATPAEAAFCRAIKDDQVCILTIKRSAKYY